METGSANDFRFWQPSFEGRHPRLDLSESAFGGALAGGDDDDGEVNRRASDDGHVRLSEPSRVSPEEAWRGVDKIKN